ncbi:efflux RND transporter permease subunit [Sutcliffiella cohnii]|uniref:efflux RND transporter permease subunit n=1 Tax=Sutcliffiella cohnii TaxID=33932 RepID=UPI002E1B4F41|nr:efflux RND transporter permease subunit [Sutcliffiella cohnii]
MKFIKMIVQRKILVGLLTVLVLLVGTYSLQKLDKELFPPIDFNGAYIVIYADDMQSIEVERSITSPLENSIMAIDGVDSVSSTSNIGVSSINVFFERGSGDEVYIELETIVSSTTANITGIRDVVTGKYSTNQPYDFFMDVSGGDLEEMTVFAQEILEPRLEDLKEVSDVLLTGIQENEIIIEFKQEKLLSEGMIISDVIGFIQQNNSEATLGTIKEEQDSPSLRWNTKFENVEDIRSMKLPSLNGFVELGDVSTITLMPKENSSDVWKNGKKDFIFVQVGRVANVTQIDMANAVREEVKKIEEEGLVKGFDVNFIVSQADYVQESIDGVSNNILIGGILAVIILLLFLRNLRATFIVGISIPTSILLTFICMWLLDYSLNILTLIGLGLGIGMMVDSAIVILESIYRKREQGLKKLDAVLEGVKEVATAVIASMLTTIVVFLPIGLLGGELGQFMIILSVVVAVTLISSVVVSFTLIPALAEKFLKLKKKKAVKKEGKLLQTYSKLVSWTVKKTRNSIAVIGIFFLMFVGSLFLVTKIPMTIMPDVFNRYAELVISMESGITPEEKQTVVEEINERLSSITDVESNYIIDDGTYIFAIINMTKDKNITREQKEVNEEIFRSLRELTETQPIVGVQSSMDAGGASPVQVNIKGDDFEQLQSLADKFIQELEAIDGVVGISHSAERTSIEEVIELNENAIEEAGLTNFQIRQMIEQAFLHFPIGEVTVNNETLPLIVTWEERINRKADLLNLEIPTNDGTSKLSEFIQLKSVNTPNAITHIDGERYISISADMEGKDLGSINREVQNVIQKFETPVGYTVAAAGDLEQQQELMVEMMMILGLAIFLVYLVMAVQFNHLIQPIIVMSIIPMTIVGVILGLVLTQRELSIMSAMGIIMLIGIVLNNAILLIDRTNQLRNQGEEIENALIEAGKNRIRPIFMTTLTTAGGMLPLALASGTSGNYQAPMATVIISGLLFATFITLLLIPAVCKLFSTIGKVGKKMFKKKNRSNKDETSEINI